MLLPTSQKSAPTGLPEVMASVLGGKRMMTQDLRVLAATSCGDFFLQGEPQENSCRESLSEALWGLGVLVCMSMVAFFYRESYRDQRRFGMFDVFFH